MLKGTVFALQTLRIRYLRWHRYENLKTLEVIIESSLEIVPNDCDVISYFCGYLQET